jgi:hypothetical protein
MKTIEPVQVWYNGAETSATVLSAMVQNDNLQNIATFQYQLMAELTMSGSEYSYPMPVVTNYLTITGQDYLDWDTNDYAYNWVATQLNLTITGEYVPPVPPAPVI